jgi:hypothetical protein
MSSSREKSLQSIEQEIAAEKAGSLFRVTSKMEAALEALRAMDREIAGAPSLQKKAQRDLLFAEAAEYVWYFVVQREALGLLTPDAVFESYGIPAEVRRNMGPRPRRGA